MNWDPIIQITGMIAAIVLPFWNIPMIVRIHRRKCADDVSLWWAFGVLTCLLLLVPSGLASHDIVFKVYSLVNFVLFAALVVQIMRYR